MAIIDKYALYNYEVGAGDTYTTPEYIGETNAQAPLKAPNALTVFVKGATETTTVTLEVAFNSCNIQQIPQPVDDDFITYKTYTEDICESINSLNGLWYRFKVTAADAAPITCFLGN